MNIILLGPPGAGKGTQARLIQDRYHLAWIATGDILREEIQRETPLGLQVKETMDAGLYPSDDIILKILEKRLALAKDLGVILDGVPRTLNQAQKVDEMFNNLGLHLDAVVQLAVDDKELIRRLSSRIVCKTCGATYSEECPPRQEGVCDKCSGREFTQRPDDKPEAIKTRLDVYNERTKPLLGYYSKDNRLKVVNGMDSVKEVNAHIESILESLQVLTDKPGCLYSAKEF